MRTTQILSVLAVLASTASAQITILSVTSAASFEAGLPPRGSSGSMFCRGLVTTEKIVQASGTPLPFSLGGVRIEVGGALAPLFAVAVADGYQQINFQVPQEASIKAGEAVPVRVTQGQAEGTAMIAPRNGPGDFFRYGDALAVVQHASDYSLVTQQNPARPGENLIAYLTGMLGTDPTVPTGQAAPAQPLARVPLQNEFPHYEIYLVDFIQGDSAIRSEPEFMGLVPGLAGVYQINFAAPTVSRAGPEWFGTRLELRLYRMSCLNYPSILNTCRRPEASTVSGRVRIWMGR